MKDKKLKVNILIIDTDYEQFRLLNTSFVSYVHGITLAQSVELAVEILQNRDNQIDVVLIDESMLRFIDTLNKMDTNIYAIALLSNTELSNIANAIDDGFSNVLKKPLDLGVLYSTLYGANRLNTAIKEKIDAQHMMTQYRNVIDNGFMVSKTDVNGIITFANDAFCKISGYSKEELIGHSHNIIRHPKMNVAVFSGMWQSIKSKKIWRGKVINKRKDSTAYYVDSVISPIIDANGNIIEFLAIRQDITKMIVANQKILKEQNEKALAAKAHYEELSRSKLTLLNLFSHELKTPLNAVINFSKIVQRRIDGLEGLSDKQDVIELMNHIVENADQMGIMINDIVNVMKLQAGAALISHQRIALTDIIHEQLSHYQHGATIDTIEDFCQNPSLITLDSIYAKKMIDNIYTNSLKYARSLVVLSYNEIDDRFILTIQDDGDGFSNPNMAIELFEQNEDNFLTRQSHGIGIGLYYAKLCAKTFGWTLTISNGCDKLTGACVTISGDIK